MRPASSLPILVLFIVSGIPCLVGASEHWCEQPKSCGRVANISSPFWFRDKQQPNASCGHSAFQLSCEGDLPLMVNSYYPFYYVHDIFYHNKSFWVKLTTEEKCPIPLYNISTLDHPGQFKVSAANRELFFFRNCPASPPNGSRQIPCAPNKTFAYLGGWYGSEDSLARSPACNTTVAPVLLNNGDEKDIVGLLKTGFLVEWTELSADCEECKRSGGRCSNGAAFMCICSDGRNEHGSCSPSKKIIGFTVGACVLAVVSVVAIFLCQFYRRRKRKQLSSVLLPGSQATSFEPSSKEDEDVVLELEQYPATKLFKYEELHEATDGFSESNELGDGGFGTVYKGTLQDGRTVAIKRLYENNYRRVEQFRTEVHILSSLRHPYLVSLYGCTSRHSRELLLVYEYIPNGTVADHLHGSRASEQGLSWRTRLRIAIETAEALSFLHAVIPQIIHRDVKTNNILLDSDFHVKVADFGLSRLFPVNATHVSTAPQGTPGYVDPEYHQCYQLTDKSDVYSFGVVLVELISSRPAVDLSRPRQEINLAYMALSKIQNDEVDQLVDPKLRQEYSSEEMVSMINSVAEVAFRCLQLERETRPTMREVFETLKGIENEVYNRGAAAAREEKDHVSLLRKNPDSPDTVTAKWESRKTTPNASG